MSRVLVFFIVVVVFGCANAEYRFERVDVDPPLSLPLKFDGLYGVRDGAMVKAEGRFVDGNDSVMMNIVVFLRPPAEFQSGTYQATIGGTMHSGSVECPSLSFQGGQTALPSVGGIFVLKDESNRPLYRVRIPATTLKRL
jgi:hypothetical protein